MTNNKQVREYLNQQYVIVKDLNKKLSADSIIQMDLMSDQEKLYLKDLLKKGYLVQESPRLLIDPDWNINDFLIRQLVLNQGIYSAFTALYLWELIDDYPYQIYMTFKMGYKLPKTYGNWVENVQPRQIDSKTLNVDVEELDVQGTNHKIKLYSKERTLVEVLREPYSLNIESVNTAFNRYLRSDEGSRSKLLEKAYQMGNLDKMQKRLELMV